MEATYTITGRIKFYIGWRTMKLGLYGLVGSGKDTAADIMARRWPADDSGPMAVWSRSAPMPIAVHRRAIYVPGLYGIFSARTRSLAIDSIYTYTVPTTTS